MKNSTKTFLCDLNGAAAALEHEIEKLVTKFEREFGVQVSDINLTRESWQNEPDFRVNASICVEIPNRRP